MAWTNHTLRMRRRRCVEDEVGIDFGVGQSLVGLATPLQLLLEVLVPYRTPSSCEHPAKF